MGGKWVRDDLRIALYMLDAGTCTWCGARGWGVPTPQVTEISLDHYVPVIRKGSNDPWNLITACCYCNSLRRDLWAPHYLDVLAREGRLLGTPDEARRRIAWVRARRRACDGRRLALARKEARALLEAPPPWLRYQRLLAARAYREDVVSGQRDYYRRLEAERAALEGLPGHPVTTPAYMPVGDQVVQGPASWWADDNPELDDWRARKAAALADDLDPATCPLEAIPF